MSNRSAKSFGMMFFIVSLFSRITGAWDTHVRAESARLSVANPDSKPWPWIVLRKINQTTLAMDY
jgi:hypothetical protein